MPINQRSQLICVHSALLTVLLMMIALVFVAGWMPPISPELNAMEIADIYRTETNTIRFTGLLMSFAAVMMWPFAVAISEQMKRVEGPTHHPMATLQLATVTLTVAAILLPAMLWMLAAYRPERAPEITQAINDFGWFLFIGTIPPAILQVLAIAYVALSERGSKRVFPRWFGFFNLWAGTGFMVGEGLFFFKTGPFAWDGLAGFWMAAVFFFGWILVTWHTVWQCIKQQAAATPHIDVEAKA